MDNNSISARLVEDESETETESSAEFTCAGILLVVAVGVAMGVFVGGVLLVCAARHVRR